MYVEVWWVDCVVEFFRSVSHWISRHVFLVVWKASHREMGFSGGRVTSTLWHYGNSNHAIYLLGVIRRLFRADERQQRMEPKVQFKWGFSCSERNWKKSGKWTNRSRLRHVCVGTA